MQESRKGTQRLRSIPLKEIQIQDDFWNPYIKLVKEVIIPYQWNTLNDLEKEAEPSHCIENFKIAAGDQEGEFQGAVFQDTDVAKWLEAVAYVLNAKRDEELERLADETINLIARAQCEDGYLNTYFTIKEPNRRWGNLGEGHELYTAGHMIEAAVAYYEATGKDKFLQIVSRFADLICDIFGPLEDQCHGYPGHQEIELALVKLFRVTGKDKYLRLAKYFIDQRGVGENYFLREEKRENFQRIFPEFKNYQPKYSQSHLPVREQKTAEGHSVRAVYMYCAMADLAYECKDETLLAACETLWDNMVYKRMYITGGIGSSGILERFTTDYDLPNDSNYSETCASIGLALFGKRMMEITRDYKYMEIVERALYNTVLSGIGKDGKSFFYVNPLEVWPDNCLDRTSKEHVKAERQKWFGVACCPPNIARTLASLGQYIYAVDKDSIYLNLFISSRTKAVLKNGTYYIQQNSYFPKEGLVEITVKKESGIEGEISLAIGIPTYASNVQIFKNDKLLENIEIIKGFAILKGEFLNDRLTISFDAVARFIRANPNVRADVGRVALMKGPFVYCLEEVDNTSNLASIYIDTNQEIQEVYETDLLGGTTTVLCKGKRISRENWQDKELYGEKKVKFEEVNLKAIPYCSWANRKTGEMLVWIKEML